MIAAATAAVGLAACGGGSPSSPHVASLGSSTAGGGHGSGSATAPKGNPTQLMDEWATCVRSHGDQNQTDPTIDQYGVIHIDIPRSVSFTFAGQVHGGTGPYGQYLLAAQKDLRAAYPPAHPVDMTEYLEYVTCMRANGVPNYPSPSGGRTSFAHTGVDPNSALFQKVSKLCGTKLHLPGWWIAGNGEPGHVKFTGAGVPPSPPACIFQPMSQGGCSDTKPVGSGNGGTGSGG